MLAKNVNDNVCFLNERGACEFFREQARSHSWIAGRQVNKRRLSGRHGSSLTSKLCRCLGCDNGGSINI